MTPPKKTGSAALKKSQASGTVSTDVQHKVSAAAQEASLEICEEELTQILEQKILPQVMVQLRQEVRHEFHSGPIPSGKQLAEYEKVCPGAAQLILNEFQKNGEHMRSMQRDALVAQKSDNDRNRWSALILVLAALIAIVVLALFDQPWVAGLLATTTVGAVITGFLNQRAKDKASNEPKESDD